MQEFHDELKALLEKHKKRFVVLCVFTDQLGNKHSITEGPIRAEFHVADLPVNPPKNGTDRRTKGKNS